MKERVVNQRKRSTPTRNSVRTFHTQQLSHLSKPISHFKPEHEHYYLKGNRTPRLGSTSNYLSFRKICILLRVRKKESVICFLGLVVCVMVLFLNRFSISGERKEYRIHPIVIGCHFSTSEHKIVKIKHLPIYDEGRYPSKRQTDWNDENEKMERTLRNSIKYNKAKVEDIDEKYCKIANNWQKISSPTCNTIHENDMSSFFNVQGKIVEERLLLLDHGFFRDIWVFKDGNEKDATVLKTLRYAHELTERNFDRHRRDALVMDRLTASPHIAQIYSFCGNSIFSEYADKGTVSDLIWPLDGGNSTLSSIERLQLALQVAQGVSDTHANDSNGIPNVAHTDITPSQFLVFDDGSIKLNDFNRCRFLKRNENNGQVCPYKITHNPGKFRSPEEYNYFDQTEKVDIYSMGNILYSIITEKWPFDELDNAKDAQEKIKNGTRPLIPEFPHDEALFALAKIVRLCWKQNAKDRPNAKDVVSALSAKIKLLSN